MALAGSTIPAGASVRGAVFAADLRGVFAAFGVLRFAFVALVIFRAAFFVALRFVRLLAIHHLAS